MQLHDRRRKKRTRRIWIALAAGLLIVGGIGVYSYQNFVAAQDEKPIAGNIGFANLSWPSYGEAAIGIVGSSTVETHGMQTPEPTASTAKLITALVVLQAKPLALGEAGPTLTMSRNDIELLKTYIGFDGSRIAKMGVGEQLSEYQMLEAMMLPSADNMADGLAIWAYGSLPAYQAAANSYLASHGITGTHIGTDASGLNPSTTSTAHDMVLIGELAMQNPVLADIVAKPSVSGFPLIGTIRNTDTLLGQSGIVGIKTGNSDQQGGAFVGAANVTVNDQTKIVVTAVMGAPSLPDAMNASLSLIKSVEAR